MFICILRSLSAVNLSSTVIQKRTYQTFIHIDALFHIYCDKLDVITNEIVRQRKILEDYIKHNPNFQHSLEPLELCYDAPEIAQRMVRAAQIVGVGPMAAVAGAMAQYAAEASLKAGASEVIVENGGDIYLRTEESVIIGLYTGTTKLADKLGFSIQAHDTPISICSSSGKIGHSMSQGDCDLATVVAKDAALADAAATLAANLVKTADDIDPALEHITSIQGIHGVVIVKNDRIGLAGHLPRFVNIN
jgi:ApbE superfamily uncharacterized protein (UPF0280 family)